MNDLQFDHDVSQRVAAVLRESKVRVTLATDLGLQSSTDAEHLLVATSNGRTLVTHNGSHFEALHDAWYRWSDAWNVSRNHSGIIVLPHQPHSALASLILGFLPTVSDFTGSLYRWRSNGGWRRLPYLP